MAQQNTLVITYGSHSIKGHRMYMEDYITIKHDQNQIPNMHESKNYLFAVYDGHGGYATAEKAAGKFSNDLFKHHKNTIFGYTSSKLEIEFLKFNRDLQSCIKPNFKGDTSGATATLVFIKNRDITIANIGDSDALLVSFSSGQNPKMTHKEITTQHNYLNLDEFKRVRDAGGIWCDGRINGEINISRAFGDFEFHPMVISNPSVKRIQLEPHHKFMIIASDGLWDARISKEKIVEQVNDDIGYNISPDQIAKKLTKLALSLGSDDNVSIIIVIFSWN